MAEKYIKMKPWQAVSCFLAIILVCVFWTKKITSSDLYPTIVHDKIGFVTDIHAASQDIRVMGGEGTENIVYPSKYKEDIDVALKKMKEEGVSLAISLGDTTNDGSVKHAKEVKRIAQEDEMDMIFVRGNHDRSKDKEDEDEKAEEKGENDILNVLDLNNPYYYIDRNDWRIIILNSNEIPSASLLGGIGDAQLDWLEEALKTEKEVLIAMHHPIWSKQNRDVLNQVYGRFYEIIRKSENVRYVLAGHEHTFDWEKEEHGITYYVLPALTLEGREGHYKTIDLESYIYE